MAEAAILAVAGWFLAPTIKELMDWARTKLGENYQFHKDFEDNREKVARALQSMRSNVEDMKKYSITDEHTWCSLWELLDAIQDAAEEFMDKLQYEVIEANREGTRKNFDGSAEKLKQLLDRLEDGKKSSRDLLKSLQRKQHHNPRPSVTTTSAQRTKELFGYKQELDDLVSELTTVGAGGTRVVGIIGHGGIGKTELAQWAFNHPKTKAKFRLRIWVSVSGMFNQDALLEQIFKSTFQGNSPGQMGGTLAFHEKKLTEKINMPGSYLLVLDDVCNDETSDELQRKTTWERVLAPFKQQEGANNRGSRILLTSRAQICLDTLGTCMDARRIKIVLNGINDTAQLKLLLMEEARRQTGATAVPQELKEHLEKNVGKLHGSPLATRKFVSLSTQFVNFSAPGNRSVLRNITIEGRIEDVLVKDHLSSFEVLPSHLQRCFAFCSIFPKGWRFEVEKLTRMWTALGFVEAPKRKGGRTVDHVAKEYFDALVERSLFQQVVGTSCYEIHEHIHSMIRTVCPSYYHRIDRRSSGIVPPTTVAHLSVTTGYLGQLQEAVGLRRLRTLLVFDKDDEDGAAAATSSPTSSSISTDEIMNKLIRQKKKDLKNKFEGVRVLDLSNTARITAVPVGIGKLEHLRYLGLPSTIGCLSDDVTKLLPLQTLSVIFSRDDCGLPRDMSRLINLLHLDLGKEEYIAQIAGIGSMRMLQDSVEFHVRRRKQGHNMRELEGLNSLRRKLTIKCLDKVRSRDQAKSARLGAKVHLKTLELEWGQRSDSAARGSAQSDLEVLEGLRPHPNLEDLKIQNYVGTKSPYWLELEDAADSVKGAVMLRQLYLLNCRNLNRLPLVGWLPNLVRMEMERLDSVKKIDATFCGGSDAFPSLKSMWLSDMAELDAWEGTGDDDGSGSAPVLFPNLQEVKIVRCTKLRSLVGLLYCRRSLTHLHVEKCPAVNTEFERSEFRPDLQLNNKDWPPRLRFKEPRRRQPPTPFRAGGQMRDRQQQQGGRPPHHPNNGVDIPPWVYPLVIFALIWYFRKPQQGRRPPRQRHRSNGVNIPLWVLLVIVVVMLCCRKR